MTTNINPSVYREACVIACQWCKVHHALRIARDDLARWKDGEFIQVAMPYLDASERELVLTRTCPTCWDDMFQGDEEE